MLGPGQLEHLAVGVGPQALVAVRPGQRGLDAHVGDLADGTGGEAVPAGLLPGEDLLLHQGHIPARLGQPVGTGRARGTTPDDQDVVHAVVVGVDTFVGATLPRSVARGGGLGGHDHRW